MKAAICDTQILKSLRPLDLAAYLRSTGWRQDKEHDRWASWVKDGDIEIALPRNKELADFALRMADVFRTLEIVEERSQLEILADLLFTPADVVRLRLADAETEDGTIPIEQGAQIAHEASNLLMAAACAAVEHREYFHTRKPSRAVDYMRKVRIGPSERGSYVLTIISRVPPALSVPQDGRLFDTEEPFERQVTLTLADSLNAAKDASEKSAATGGFDSFLSAVSKGVSANFCEAIVGIGTGGEKDRSLDIGFTWSRMRPNDSSGRRFILPADAMPVIAEAARIFRERAPREEFELRGSVVKLERADLVTGKATVLGLVDVQLRKVVIELSGPEHHSAVQAYENRDQIVCYGVLLREGRYLTLKNPHDFKIEAGE